VTTINAADEATMASTNISSLNWEVLGAYYQLSNPVKFKKGWQVLTQIVDKMNN